MKKVQYANAVIFDESNQQVLLVRNGTESSSYWSLPGGGVEVLETLEQAVAREVKEETGYTVVTHGLYAVREVLFKNRKEHALIFTFFAKITGGQLQISDPDNEILEAKWLDIKTANELMPYIPKHMNVPTENTAQSAHYYFHGDVDE